MATKRLLARLTKISESFPETSTKSLASHTQFFVRKKTYAYFLDEHHTDGILSVCVKVAPDVNTQLVAQDAARFYLPAYIGARGWVGLRLDTKSVDWDEVTVLMRDSYCASAPSKLAALVSSPRSR